MVISMAKKTSYGNNDIVALKGPDQVRKRPAVIFGSDGLEGCQHSVFEILSNSIDEAREGFGDKIIITRFLDKSVEIQDFGRGIPVDYNEKEKNYNWFLVFCTLYAGGKYNTNNGGSYEYSLGLNGLGLCATQFASEYMEAEIHRDGWCYKLNFKKGKAVGEMEKEKYTKVVVDAENYRAKRERTLEQLANRLAAKVVKTRKHIRLEPMNPYERKVIHATLQKNPNITTRSEGEEPYRRVVIELKK